ESMLDWLVQVQASGSPSAPPEETIIAAPSDLAFAISGSMKGSLPSGSVSPHSWLQPTPMTKAAVKALSPCWVMPVSSSGSCELDMSTDGATPDPPAWGATAAPCCSAAAAAVAGTVASTTMAATGARTARMVRMVRDLERVPRGRRQDGGGASRNNIGLG